MPDDNASVSVVIPTYNERDNIHELLTRIQRSMESTRYTYEILIVDDDSLDGTSQIAPHYSESYPVRLIRRKGKRGLSMAVLEGINTSKYDIIVVIDADLQHAPETVPELISCVSKGTDIAIGSRFVESAAVETFGLVRRIISRAADLLARTLFRQIRSVKDVESGFFAFRRDVIKGTTLDPVGYKVLLEILILGNYSTISEIPYKFNTREAGVSKLGVKNSLQYARHMSSLFQRSGELHRFLRFAVVGAIGAVFNLAVLYALAELGVFYLLAGFIGIEAGLLSNFFLNRSWTYKDRQKEGPGYVLTALYRDHAVRFVGIILNLAILWLLTSVFGLYYLTSQLIGIVVAMFWNYSGNQWWTWEPKAK